MNENQMPAQEPPALWIQRARALLSLRKGVVLATITLVGIAGHLVARYGLGMTAEAAAWPLIAVLVICGVPMLLELGIKLVKLDFGSDLLGGIAIVTSVLLKEYLAGSIIVLMLTGGEALESYALRSASSVLAALAKRMPSIAHRKVGDAVTKVQLADINVGDILVLFPHETCPVDGVVLEGHSKMDESYLTGEPFQITKTAGSEVIAGAINGEAALTFRATKQAADSRYAKIMMVMRESEAQRPQLRRLGDQLGAIYTPVAVSVALIAWLLSGEAVRFLAVLVIATPCPLLIGIPVAIIGSISLCARRAIIVKSPVVLEQIAQCRTAIFDKTGTLTYGEPQVTDEIVADGIDSPEVLRQVASLERYSKHPLARAILEAAEKQGLELAAASEVSEVPGKGLVGTVGGQIIQVTSRRQFTGANPIEAATLPAAAGGLECVILRNEHFVALLRFRDRPRDDSKAFVTHLGPKHAFNRVMIISGDRASEVNYLAEQVGVTEIFADQTPEMKLTLVRKETELAKTLYVGDGINDAPAMLAATVGIAIGQNSDVTAEAAGVVIMDNSLEKVDEFMHISRRMRTIALQSAVGGMVLSLVGMGFAAGGYLKPVMGAILQEVIDVLAVLNALRAAFPPRVIHDI